MSHWLTKTDKEISSDDRGQYPNSGIASLQRDTGARVGPGTIELAAQSWSTLARVELFMRGYLSSTETPLVMRRNREVSQWTNEKL
ncbi:hypothetical protein J6590_089529 [Homalodisca vitripennis]|nr:hypothetical protein J6590_089529 [Homalodisca vitripennis]